MLPRRAFRFTTLLGCGSNISEISRQLKTLRLSVA